MQLFITQTEIRIINRNYIEFNTQELPILSCSKYLIYSIDNFT
jgi:hypothetical protein